MNYRILPFLFVALLTLSPLVPSFAAPNTLTVSPQIPRRPAHVRHAVFANGMSAVMAGNTITITLRNGNRLVIDHPNPVPVAPRPAIWCEKLKHWLDTHGNSATWRKHCLTYFDNCVGDD